MKIMTTSSNSNERLDVFLSEHLDYSRSKISSFIDKNTVLVNSKPQKSSYKLKENDVVEFSDSELERFINPVKKLVSSKIELDIKYEDDYLIVLNKPKGLVVHPTKYEQTDTLANALLYHCNGKLSDISGVDRPGIVHRLDKDTAGLMVAVKDNETHKSLAEQIKTKALKRKYLAIANGVFEKQEGIIDKPLLHYFKDDVKMSIAPSGQGLEAVTLYKVVQQYEKCALVELELKTGRTHQIRAHLASIGHSVFGDKLYGAAGSKIKTQGQLLQSYFISFTHPKTSKKMEFKLEENEFSDDFIKVLNILRRQNDK